MKMKTITEIIKIKMVKNMEVKMKMIWASSYHFREIPHFCGILPYFTVEIPYPHIMPADSAIYIFRES
jgi:hypothetical protein